MTDKEFVVVGKIGKAHGVRGEFKVHHYTETPKNFTSFNHYFIQSKAGWQPLNFESKRLSGNSIIAKIADCDSPEDVKQDYTNKEISVAHTELPALGENEFYRNDLFGLKVITTQGKSLGEIAEIMETGSNDVLIVKGEEKTHAIPYLWDNCIQQIDLEANTMIVDWDDTF